MARTRQVMPLVCLVLAMLSVRAPEATVGARPWTMEDALAALKPEDALPPNLKVKRPKASKRKSRFKILSTPAS